jgi:hypothetical protein
MNLDLNENDLDTIIRSLKTELRNLRETMNNLERNGFVDGDMNVRIQMRMHEVNGLLTRLMDRN